MKFEVGVMFLISVVGATLTTTIYLNSTFATQKAVDSLEEKISRIDGLICGMAIAQGLHNAKEICKGIP